MQSRTAPEAISVRLRLYGWAVLFIWTAMILGSLFWNLHRQDRLTLELALQSARIVVEKDILYRRWNSRNGGVYVFASELTPPNPYLRVPERDIHLPDGRTLTLVNPAYMTRQIHEMERAATGVGGHLTSLKLLRPENVADFWETRALEAFERGVREVHESQQINAQPYLRLMQPLRVEQGCLNCHSEQGYKPGDLLGGISASVPMAGSMQLAAAQKRFLMVVHLIIWCIGLAGNHLGIRKLSAQLRQWRSLQEKVWHQANYDALTGLPNRSLFYDRLGLQIATCARSGEPFPLMSLDLDGFKDVNDSLGHDAGDEVLRMAAERLLECVRASDTVARMGGDEFSLILPGATRRVTVEKVALKILSRMREPFLIQGQEVRISVSVGAAFHPQDAPTQAELLKKADTALYASKRGGKGRFSFAEDPPFADETTDNFMKEEA